MHIWEHVSKTPLLSPSAAYEDLSGWFLTENNINNRYSRFSQYGTQQRAKVHEMCTTHKRKPKTNEAKAARVVLYIRDRFSLYLEWKKSEASARAADEAPLRTTQALYKWRLSESLFACPWRIRWENLHVNTTQDNRLHNRASLSAEHDVVTCEFLAQYQNNEHRKQHFKWVHTPI